MHKTDTPEKVTSTDELGHLPERTPVDWRGHGLSWALADSMASQRDDEWTADDVARAFADGAARGIAADRDRIVNALPGGYSVDPQWVADMVRDGPAYGKPVTSEHVA